VTSLAVGARLRTRPIRKADLAPPNARDEYIIDCHGESSRQSLHSFAESSRQLVDPTCACTRDCPNALARPPIVGLNLLRGCGG